MRRSFVLLIILSLFAGCNKYMEFPAEGEIPQSKFYQNADDAKQAMVSMYGLLRSYAVFGGTNYLILSEFTSDNVIKGSVAGDGEWALAYSRFQFTADEGLNGSLWGGRYSGINLSNQIITNVPEVAMDQSTKDRFIAEAKFFRAFHYFYLVRGFGGVPIVDRVPVGAEAGVRKSVDETWDFIEKDLNEAIPGLPDAVPAAELGRATKWAAKFLLAKAYLYREKWTECKALTDEIIASNKYSLYPDFYKLFRPEQEFCSESIFEVLCSNIGDDWGLSSCQYSQIQGVRNQFDAWGWGAPSDNLAAAFDAAGDVIRKKATILYRGDVTPDGDLIEGSVEMPGVSVPRYSGKAYVPSRFPITLAYYGSDQNIRIMRYAEALLMNAEAAVHTGGDAATPLNKVRARAGLPPISSPTIQQVWNERRLELACEQDRFWDLVRTKQAATVLAGQGFKVGKHELYPIPPDEVNLSQGTIYQNPGW